MRDQSYSSQRFDVTRVFGNILEEVYQNSYFENTSFLLQFSFHEVLLC